MPPKASGGKNWIQKYGPGGHLPDPIHTMYKHIKRSNPAMSTSHAIAAAVEAAKKGCATGDVNFPGKQEMNAVSRARYCNGVAAWEAMKARAKAARATK